MYTKVTKDILKKEKALRNLDVDVRRVSRLILVKGSARVLSRLIWLRINQISTSC